MILYIDDVQLELKENTQISILEACKYAGINLPRFCYHETLSVAGNCRMCLVEVENEEKPVASCVTEINNQMSIFTDSAFVQKARENVVEALLLNHPLDCPICDQAGECDLQDQTKSFGGVHNRFFYDKKGVENKYCGPLIKTIMTRCISCTRCVRYSAEVTGVDFFGTLNRGKNTEIGSYVSDFFSSEISANVVDLCPVGALTSKPYAFKSRPWELRIAETIDSTDSSGSNIYVNFKENQIYRILPKNNEQINNFIISDKARFVYDSNNTNRIKFPFVYNKNKKQYEQSHWEFFLEKIEEKVQEKPLIFFINGKTDFHDALAMKTLSHAYPEKFSIVSTDIKKSENIALSYEQLSLSNKISEANDTIILLGLNSRNEIPVFNVKIRNKNRNQLLSIFLGGFYFNENLGGSFLNLNLSQIFKLFDGKTAQMANMYFSKNSLIITGESFQNRLGFASNVFSYIKKYLKTLRLFNVKGKVNTSGIETLGIKNYLPKMQNSNSIIYNIDDSVESYLYFKHGTPNLENSFWFNSHGTTNLSKYSMILPSFTHFESEKTYLNTEFRPQNSAEIVNNSGAITYNFTLKTLSALFRLYGKLHLKKHSPFKNVGELLLNESKYSLLSIQKQKLTKRALNILETFGVIFSILKKLPIFEKHKNFYRYNTLTRNSTTLRSVSEEFIVKNISFPKIRNFLT